LGLGAAILWLCVNLGGKFWQVRWEQQLHDEEVREHFPKDMRLFSADKDELECIVSRGLGTPRAWRLDRRLWHRAILIKPSVSLMMTYLSCCFIVVWLA